MMRKKSVIAGVLTLALACDSPTGKNPGADIGTFSAQIDGANWQSVPGTVSGVGAGAGVFTFSGFDSTRASPLGVTVSLYNIDKPGTYSLGVTPSVVGGHVRVQDGTQEWQTPHSGTAGTIQLTTVTERRLAGTFSLTVGPGFGTATTRTITNAHFDVPIVSEGSIIVPSYKGSTLSGTMGGVRWGASTVDAVVRLDEVLVINTSDNRYAVTITVPAFAGPGTFAVGSTGTASVRIRTQPDDWGGGFGTIIVSTANSSRVTGSFDVTLLPFLGSEPAGPLRFVGTLSVGLRLPP